MGPDLIGLLGLLVLTLLLYLPYATKAGWYLDDWITYAELKASQGFWDGMSTCMDSVPGGRKLACAYHATEWSLLGNHRWAYHLVSIAFLFTIVALAYAIARRAGLSRPWCLAIGAAIVLFPGADSTRLWPVASIGQYVIVLQMTSLLIALIALGRAWGAKTCALHALSALLALLAMATYEIAVPLVALQGVVYVAAFRNVQAIKRWMLDIGLVLAFVVYRLTLGRTDDPAFMVDRTTGQLVSRVGTLLEGAWNSWRYLYVPSSAVLIVVAILLIAGLATAFSAELRGRMIRWWFVLLVGALAAGACALVFLTADDTYVPQYFSTSNRLNLPGTIPYVLAFVGVLGLVYEMVRRWSPWSPAAPLCVILISVFVAAHQINVSSSHQDSWLASWSVQERTLPRLRTALRDVPPTARVLGFDTPRWERDWIPIFAQSWGFRGAIEYETDIESGFSAPFDEDTSCGARGIEQFGELVAPYDDRTYPVFFVSPDREVAVKISSKKRCDGLLTKWQPVPYWGSTVTG